MTEEVKDTANADEAKQTTPDTQDTEKVYGQKDVDNIVNSVKTRLEKDLEETRKQLEKFKAQAMTEDEKKLAEAEARGAEKLQAQFDAYKRESEVKLLLASRGITDVAKAERLARLVDSEGDPAEAVEALVKEMPEVFSRTNLGGLGGRNPNPGEPGEISEEYANEMILKHGPQWLTPERLKKLNEYRGAHASFRRL